MHRRIGAGVTLLLWACAGHVAPVHAQPTINAGTSVLIFPKIIADGSRDTVIQLVNTSNSERYAWCFYTDAELFDVVLGGPCAVISPFCQPLWTTTDFRIRLTRQQPTYWVASQGRPLDPTDSKTGYDPGSIPPVSSSGFVGALRCVEVDAAGFPLSGNALIGSATITDVVTGDSSRYNAVGLRGFDTNNQDFTLCLGGDVNGACPFGAEYEACPEQSSFGFFTEDSQDPVAGTGTVETTLTILPCSQDYEFQIPGHATLGYKVINEFEQLLSGTASIDCWADTRLSALGFAFSFAALGTTYAQATFSPAPGSGSAVMVADERHEITGAPPRYGSAAVNVHVDGSVPGGDQMRLPSLF